MIVTSEHTGSRQKPYLAGGRDNEPDLGCRVVNGIGDEKEKGEDAIEHGRLYYDRDE
jgi:hypothetical protein